MTRSNDQIFHCDDQFGHTFYANGQVNNFQNSMLPIGLNLCLNKEARF